MPTPARASSSEEAAMLAACGTTDSESDECTTSSGSDSGVGPSPPGRARAALLPAGLLLAGLAAAFLGRSTGVLRPQRRVPGTGQDGLRSIIQRDGMPESYPAKGCFTSKAEYDPVDMKGMTRLKYDTIEKCQQRCRETAGCAHISYWPDWGCHLADADAKLIDGDTEAMVGPPSCDEPVCFQHAVEYEPMGMVGQQRVEKSTAAECHSYCIRTEQCTTFTWWPDGGCHVQDSSARPKQTAAHVVSGPATCPLFPTTAAPTTPEPATTPEGTEEPTTSRETVTTEKTTTTEETTTTAYPPTPAPMPFGCRADVKLTLTGHRGQKLTDRMPCHWSSSSCDRQGHWDAWYLSDAGDGKFFITSPSHNHLQLTDDQHHLRLVADKGSWESWTITDAGAGQAFLRSHRGMYIQDSHGHLQMTHNADNWEKWMITDDEGEPACRFPTVNLFCFLVMRSWGHELEMVTNMHDKSAGIFHCDSAMVFSDASIQIGTPPDVFSTTLLYHDVLQHQVGVYENQHLFIKVWEHIQWDGRYKIADWVIKTDPDTVFLPDRLRARLGGSSHATAHATFFANCAGSGDIQKQDRHSYMYGPLEVFSSKAVDMYFEHSHHCVRHIHLHDGMWEERYMTHCLELIQVPLNIWDNNNFLSDPHCDEHLSKPNCGGDAVAMHPLASAHAWSACYDEAHHGEDGHD